MFIWASNLTIKLCNYKHNNAFKFFSVMWYKSLDKIFYANYRHCFDIKRFGAEVILHESERIDVRLIKALVLHF